MCVRERVRETERARVTMFTPIIVARRLNADGRERERERGGRRERERASVREKEREREQDHPRYPYRVKTGRFEPWGVGFTKLEPSHTSSSATGLSRVAELTRATPTGLPRPSQEENTPKGLRTLAESQGQNLALIWP